MEALRNALVLFVFCIFCFVSLLLAFPNAIGLFSFLFSFLFVWIHIFCGWAMWLVVQPSFPIVVVLELGWSLAFLLSY